MPQDPFEGSGRPIVNPWHTRLRELHYQYPFRSFVIRTKDGVEFLVRDPLHILFASVLDSIHVRQFPADEGAKSVVRTIPVAEVETIYESGGEKAAGNGEKQDAENG